MDAGQALQILQDIMNSAFGAVQAEETASINILIGVNGTTTANATVTTTANATAVLPIAYEAKWMGNYANEAT